ncbi:MAG: hypothetical protein HW421_2739 [Ignavibacteria bacterium]|nr:hypothetical protein [Ignavibacteria bacterium]
MKCRIDILICSLYKKNIQCLPNIGCLNLKKTKNRIHSYSKIRNSLFVIHYSILFSKMDKRIYKKNCTKSYSNENSHPMTGSHRMIFKLTSTLLLSIPLKHRLLLYSLHESTCISRSGSRIKSI